MIEESSASEDRPGTEAGRTAESGRSAAPAEPAASQLPHDDASPVAHDVAEGERDDDEQSGRHQEDDAAAPGSGSSED